MGKENRTQVVTSCSIMVVQEYFIIGFQPYKYEDIWCNFTAFWAFDVLWDSPELDNVAGESEVWVSLLRMLSQRPDFR